MIRLFNISSLLFALLLLSASIRVQAQGVVHGDEQQTDSIPPIQRFGNTIPDQPFGQQELFKPHVNVSLGSSFTGFGSGFNAFGTYLAPEISMPVAKKFSVTVGLGYSSMFYNFPNESGFSGSNQSYGNLFVSGTYRVNEKLVVRGTAYKTFLLNPAPASGNKPINPQFFDFSSQGVIFDAEYKVSERFKVGVSVEYREQNYPSLYQNPNGFNNFGNSPFRRSPFVPGL